MGAFRGSPEAIRDRKVLASAIDTLDSLEAKYGRPYVFEYVQQPMVGGACHPVPVDSRHRDSSSRVLGRYDRAFFVSRLQNPY